MVKRIDALEEKLDFLLNTVSLSRVVESPTGPVQAKATLGEIFESFRNKGVECRVKKIELHKYVNYII